jgi:hypothetical protein
MRFANAIESWGLLDDFITTTYEIPSSTGNRGRKSARIMLLSWIVTTWILFAGILSYLFHGAMVTQIGKRIAYVSAVGPLLAPH